MMTTPEIEEGWQFAIRVPHRNVNEISPVFPTYTEGVRALLAVIRNNAPLQFRATMLSDLVINTPESPWEFKFVNKYSRKVKGRKRSTKSYGEIHLYPVGEHQI